MLHLPDSPLSCLSDARLARAMTGRCPRQRLRHSTLLRSFSLVPLYATALHAVSLQVDLYRRVDLPVAGLVRSSVDDNEDEQLAASMTGPAMEVDIFGSQFTGNVEETALRGALAESSRSEVATADQTAMPEVCALCAAIPPSAAALLVVAPGERLLRDLIAAASR